ncbi:MAG TPA: quinone-dependent dihydroorotate dehydrogenase, partial [Solimonas sp.]
MYELARSLLFRLDAERAHELTLASFRRAPKLATLPFAHAAVDDPVELLGLRFANRVGLAAGLDKNGECLDAWARLGFGFVEVGTVTPRPQPGNPKPRMFRLPAHGAIINRLGFNNKGVDHLLARVAE